MVDVFRCHRPCEAACSANDQHWISSLNATAFIAQTLISRAPESKVQALRHHNQASNADWNDMVVFLQGLCMMNSAQPKT